MVFLQKPFKVFVDFYSSFRLETNRLTSFRYRIFSTIEEYKSTGKVVLAHTDKPGDFLPPLFPQQIKEMPDILSNLHPIDVNSINDLYYLSKDKISKIIISRNKIHTCNFNNEWLQFSLDTSLTNEVLHSKRIAYAICYMQAEGITREHFPNNVEKYRILSDHITSLSILNIETNETILKSAQDILFSKEYLFFSKEDIARIAFICGQMASLSLNQAII
ncbi:hypothetical protein [Legionella septentrionalis]|uniref:hypothetical protein n=1 Tax=Legionella septentrionalis TaxID=2498109 RepID=UPI000F8E382D|nr:hypothetical protein [Legionella septentrionalis]RUQ93677.1 hypothetical protein ELY11_11565 [Legionella septentrionalis]